MSVFITVQNVRDELLHPFTESEYYGEKANGMYSDEDIQETINDVLEGKKLPELDEDDPDFDDDYWEEYSDYLYIITKRLRNGAYEQEIREERGE